MGLQVFRKTSRIGHSAQTVYDWHARPGAFQRLAPPWDSVQLIEHTGGIEDGARAVLELRVGPVPVTWVAEHRDNVPGRQFTDVQVEGPFARWEHAHRFEPIEAEACLLEDRIEYALPLEAVHSLISRGFVEARLQRGFDFRHRVTRRDLGMHAGIGLEPGQRFAVSGASGLLGSTLTEVLATGGHHAWSLARTGSASRVPLASAGSISWDPRKGSIDAAALEGTDYVVHLAGASIADGRWSEERRSLIRESRVQGTRLIAETLAALDRPPRALICASATGWYGDRGDERLDESSRPGEGFLPEVCRDWEAAADPAREAGIRVVHLRFGMILWPDGGALERMLMPFLAGAGGRMGSGDQFWTWVSLDDAVAAVMHAAARQDLEGPVNVVAPEPIRNRDFTAALGSVLKRPTLVPAPAPALRLALGAMADELLLASARVYPKRLEATGFPFRDPELEPALRHMLGRTERK
ncbi:MAG: TIGR01777 family oxidoreductase [marine benthic group bacterium]|nr:TIGR01777 family oxidoreductase [Gemmatimonadota bacterium]